MYWEHFEHITSDDRQMIFGCYCKLHDKPIYAYDCKECKDKRGE